MLCGRYVCASRNTFYNGTSMVPIQLFLDSREAVLFGFTLSGCVAVSFNKKTNTARFHKKIWDFQTHNADAPVTPKSKKHEWHDLYLLSPPPPPSPKKTTQKKKFIHK
jgi:hypothetical protein